MRERILSCQYDGSAGSLCASWQCLEAPWGPPPSLAVQFVGSGTSLSGMEVELVGGRYRMSLGSTWWAAHCEMRILSFLAAPKWVELPCFLFVIC
ncbi:hypothetical protein JZ751_025147 [Albula glossodonta]|uniref:Uncharacterized protein n=1 Tax=Albula glossodonta TaxID=121402 RepID=A0A8T2PFF2_9TELE|nr:hypothetical protein JZ751_025147 [Albula glossodonta]